MNSDHRVVDSSGIPKQGINVDLKHPLHPELIIAESLGESLPEGGAERGVAKAVSWYHIFREADLYLTAT